MESKRYSHLLWIRHPPGGKLLSVIDKTIDNREGDWKQGHLPHRPLMLVIVDHTLNAQNF